MESSERRSGRRPGLHEVERPGERSWARGDEVGQRRGPSIEEGRQARGEELSLGGEDLGHMGGAGLGERSRARGTEPSQGEEIGWALHVV